MIILLKLLKKTLKFGALLFATGITVSVISAMLSSEKEEVEFIEYAEAEINEALKIAIANLRAENANLERLYVDSL